MTNFYEDRLDAKRERLEAAAAKAEAESAARLASAKQLSDMIPFGQPILVGHYSEGRHRRDLDRIHDGYGKGFELQDRAQELGRRADQLGRHGVASDDPDAVAKLQRELAVKVASRDKMKATNAVIRKHAKKGRDAQTAALVEMGWSQAEADELLAPGRFGGDGFASFQLTNLGANIRRVRARIAEVSTLVLDDDDWSRSGVAPDGTEWEMTLSEGRYDLEFSDRCDDEVRRMVRSHGFVWAPSRKVWTRKVTKNAAAGAERLARVLATTTNEEQQ